MPHSEGSAFYLGLQSPDLNHIEHLWDHLGKVVDEMRPTLLPDLKEPHGKAYSQNSFHHQRTHYARFMRLSNVVPTYPTSGRLYV